MKEHLTYLLIGFAIGLAFFFGTPIIFQKNVLYLDAHYYFLFIPLFVVLIFIPPYKRQLDMNSNKISFLFFSFISFSIGFFLPIFTWFLIVARALSSWTLF